MSTTTMFLLIRRCWAFGVDLFFILSLSRVMIHATIALCKVVIFHFSYHQQLMMNSFIAPSYLSLIFLNYTAYFFLSYKWGRGKTLGMILFALKFKSHEDDGSLSWKESALRTTINLLSLPLFCLPLTLPLFTRDQRGFADIISQNELSTSSGVQNNLVPIPIKNEQDEKHRAA